jgi:phosphohistidine swiveling domain-containing protein
MGPPNPTIAPLDQITGAEASRAGAKAYNCARLKKAGFPVPDGLVVLSDATAADLATLARHAWVAGLPADVVFAVRSSGIGEDSAGESFAGIHQTLLDVGRAELAPAVAACRASARSTPALEYRRAKGISTDTIEMGVLIQCMVHPVAAGVAFTVNPVTGADHELVINSSWGLGEALVSGQIDPDEFVVGKRDGELQWSRIGEKGNAGLSATASLTPDLLAELAIILTGIERHYGAPQDVEWCHDGARFWVVQSRPVTTTRARPAETEWTRANIAEVLPDLTSPQALAAFEDLLNRAERKYLGKLLAPEEELGPMVKSFCGRLHFNLSQLRRVCAMGGMAPAAMLRSMGHAEAIQPSDEQAQRPPIGALVSCAPDLFRILWRHRRAAREIHEHEARTRHFMSRFTVPDSHQLSDAEMWSAVEEWFREAPEYMQTVLLLANVLFHELPVQKVCEKVGFPFEQLVYPQLAAGERSVSAQQAFDLVALADVARHEPAVVQYLAGEAPDLSRWRAALRGTEFAAGFERFLERYGHRGLYEYDWSLPRYKEDPTPLLLALRAHLETGSTTDAAETVVRQSHEAASAWTAFEQRLSAWQKWTTLRRIRRSIRTIKRYYVWREQVRSDVARALAALRAWHLVLAERFVERGWLNSQADYFLLQFAEIGSIIGGHRDPGSLRAIVAERIAERERHRSLRMPLLMRASELPALIRIAGISGGPAGDSELTGQVVSGGCVEAEVVVVRDPGDFGRMKFGAILVAPATDPSWTPLFTLASGVIVEVGGVLSHASTIAREYGIPALANVKDATRRLRTGERVRLDATHGVVQRLPVDVRATDGKRLEQGHRVDEHPSATR